MDEHVVRLLRHGSGELALSVDGRLLDLTDHLARHGIAAPLPQLLAEGWFLREALEPRLAHPDWRELTELGPPLPPLLPREVGKILALGKNFRAHAEEFREEVPEETLYFNKLPETLVADGAEVRVAPEYTRRVDHEAELAVVIGREGRAISVERALEHVAAWSVANDLTARSLQGHDRKRMLPWFRSKNMDGFCPFGPCLVPRDYLDPADLRITATVNGELRQDARTRDLVVGIPEAIATLSVHLTLRPGDLVLMGTPAGVGPLEDGDEVVCSVEGIGDLRTTIRR